jgi:AcrR family transcriptional regulator
MPSITRRRAVDPDRRASVEAQILATTERLLAGGASFTELGVQRIAAEAGVARSTFYTHFRDKSELLVRLANTMQDTAFDIVRTWRPTGPGGGLDGLIEVFVQVIAIYREYASVLTAVNEVSSYDATVRDLWGARTNRFVDLAAQFVIAEQEAGRTSASVDAVVAGRLNIIGGDRFIAHHISIDDGTGDATAAGELARTWWFGMLRRPAD